MKVLAKVLQASANKTTIEGRECYRVDFERLSTLLVFAMWTVETDAFGKAPRAVRMLMARVIESLGGVQVLFNSGFPASGATAVRSLFEATATLVEKHNLQFPTVNHRAARYGHDGCFRSR